MILIEQNKYFISGWKLCLFHRKMLSRVCNAIQDAGGDTPGEECLEEKGSETLLDWFSHPLLFPAQGEGCGEHLSMNLDRGNLWSCFVMSTQYTSCLVCKLQTNSFFSETRTSPAPTLEKPPGNTAFFVLHLLVSWHFAFFLGQWIRKLCPWENVPYLLASQLSQEKTEPPCPSFKCISVDLLIHELLMK